LITGASSGLGAEFARQLGSLGYNLILTARRKERLQQLAVSLQSMYGIYPQIQPADLSKLTDIENLVSMINNLDNLQFLVNNAGFGTVGRFHRVDTSKELAMVNVHMLAPVMLCRAAIPGMVSRDQGSIINVSSLAGLIPIRNVLYHSTKAFLVNFSEALHSELHGTHVNIQALCPGFILTEFHDTIEYSRFSRRGIPKFLWMTTDQVVMESLKSLSRGKLICIPGGIYHFAGVLSRNTISAGLIKGFARIIVQKRKPSKI
jgi:short-subunit dehydrogenase